MKGLTAIRQPFGFGSFLSRRSLASRAPQRTLIFLLSFPAIATWSQEAATPFREPITVSAELVQVDVLVSDRDGKPVRLAREDFEVYADGKLQHITHFAHEQSRLNKIEEDSDLPRSLPRAMAAGELRRAIAFVVDTLNMSGDSVLRTRRMLDDFIDKRMEPGDIVLIMPTGGGSGLLQQFTADQRMLRRAVSRLHPLARTSSLEPPEPEQHDVVSTTSTIGYVVTSMGRLPGRKLGVFVSDGFGPQTPWTRFYLTDTAERAARANVVFYSIEWGYPFRSGERDLLWQVGLLGCM